MDLTKKIIAMENNSKQGESQVYKCIDAASLHKLYKFYKNAKKDSINTVVLTLDGTSSLLLDKVSESNLTHQSRLAQIYYAALIGKKIGSVSYRAKNCLNGFDNGNLQQISDANFSEDYITNLKKNIYVFINGEVTPRLQMAVNDYFKTVTVKLFTTESKLSSSGTLYGDVITEGKDYIDKTKEYCKVEKSK